MVSRRNNIMYININRSPILFSLRILNDRASESIELPFPVWKYEYSTQSEYETIYVYKLYNIEKLKARYKITKEKFAALYSNMLYKMIVGEDVEKYFFLLIK